MRAPVGCGVLYASLLAANSETPETAGELEFLSVPRLRPVNPECRYVSGSFSSSHWKLLRGASALEKFVYADESMPSSDGSPFRSMMNIFRLWMNGQNADPEPLKGSIAMQRLSSRHLSIRPQRTRAPAGASLTAQIQFHKA